MFRSDLKRRLHGIFDMAQTTFEAPSHSYEQNILFIEIHEANCRVSRANGGVETARVTGSVVVFSRENKLTYGFFNKRIEQANPELTKNLFFYDIDIDIATSPARMQNIHERRCNFVFLYDAQYDPNQGEMTEINFGG